MEDPVVMEEDRVARTEGQIIIQEGQEGRGSFVECLLEDIESLRSRLLRQSFEGLMTFSKGP